MALVEPNREAFVVHDRFAQPDRSKVPACAHPVTGIATLDGQDQLVPQGKVVEWPLVRQATQIQRCVRFLCHKT
jgi:hypothetical protein